LARWVTRARRISSPSSNDGTGSRQASTPPQPPRLRSSKDNGYSVSHSRSSRRWIVGRNTKQLRRILISEKKPPAVRSKHRFVVQFTIKDRGRSNDAREIPYRNHRCIGVQSRCASRYSNS